MTDMRGGEASILCDAYDICIDKSGAMVVGSQLFRPRTEFAATSSAVAAAHCHTAHASRAKDIG